MVTVVVLMNPFHFDRDQQLALFVAIVALAYLAATAVHRMRTVTKLEAPVSAETNHPAVHGGPGQAAGRATDGIHIEQRSEGPNSPNIVTTGPNSPVTIEVPRPWTLTTPQRDLLVRRMAVFNVPDDEAFDLIVCNFGDPESKRLAAELVAVLRAAGWTLSGSGYGQADTDPTPEGITVRVHAGELPPPAAALARVLMEAGVITPPAHILQDPTIPAGKFRVRVGRQLLR